MRSNGAALTWNPGNSSSILARSKSVSSDEELLSIIYTVGSEVGLAPIKAIEPESKALTTEPIGPGVLRLVPKV